MVTHLRLLDFQIGDDRGKFAIRMFGLDESGKSCSVLVDDFEPFFYIKVADHVSDHTDTKYTTAFLAKIVDLLRIRDLRQRYQRFQAGKVWGAPRPNKDEGLHEFIDRCLAQHTVPTEIHIISCELVKRQKLYGFDGRKKHNFILIKFRNLAAMNKVKNLWYDKEEAVGYGKRPRWSLKTLKILDAKTDLYEANIPPLLRYLHIYQISPSGWITVPRTKQTTLAEVAVDGQTRCDYEFLVSSGDITPLPGKESLVPIKICSFDIEASSSHGDFPVAVKGYGKLAKELTDYWDLNQKMVTDLSQTKKLDLIRRLIETALGCGRGDFPISRVYLKHPHTVSELAKCAQNTVERTPELVALVVDSRSNQDRFRDLVQQLDLHLPSVKGDKTTFIGAVLRYEGQKDPYLLYCGVLGTCSPVKLGNKQAIIRSHKTERDLLLDFAQFLREHSPDLLVGFNIFGFDWKFLIGRAKENNCYMPRSEGHYGSRRRRHRGNFREEKWFSCMSKLRGHCCIKQERTVQVASGAHLLCYPKIPGTIQLDLYNHFRRSARLSSYKLEHVARHFISGEIKHISMRDEMSIFQTKNLMGLEKGNYVCLEFAGHTAEPYKGGAKFEVLEVDRVANTFTLQKIGAIDRKGKKLRWTLGKDDITPTEIFEKAAGSAADRAVVAKYCIMDCILVDKLLEVNDIMTSLTQVASICTVPIDFAIMRGEGIKLLSYISKKCREDGILMPVIQNHNYSESYEGALCLDPKCAFYRKNPIAVVDFSSLYPSCMISENISHDSKVWTKEYDLDGNLVKTTGTNLYDNLPGYEYVDIEYDTYKFMSKPGVKKKTKMLCGKKICRFAQFPDNAKATIPAIARELLAARKVTRAHIKYKTITKCDGAKVRGICVDAGNHYIVTESLLEKGRLQKHTHHIKKNDIADITPTYDSFMQNILEKRQLGFKVTANSVYGQCGAPSSPYYDKDLAASVTATGRKHLLCAKAALIAGWKNRICKTEFGKHTTTLHVVYGDTDSCFFYFDITDENGQKITGRDALPVTIVLAQRAAKLITKFLKPPHDLEYEKTFWPFFLLRRKGYTGNKYGLKPTDPKRVSMGIVLTRRDNAPIVKDIYGGTIDILLRSQDLKQAESFVRNCLQKMVKEGYSHEKLIVSKSLAPRYKNPDSVAHKVLADRMAARDPGSAPAVGSRIPYIYIQTRRKTRCQGDRIETPAYIAQHNLRPDYLFYITNQIQKPIQQIFSLILEDLPSFARRLPRFRLKVECLRQEHGVTSPIYRRKLAKLRADAVTAILFADALRDARNIRDGQKTVLSFFNQSST